MCIITKENKLVYENKYKNDKKTTIKKILYKMKTSKIPQNP